MTATPVHQQPRFEDRAPLLIAGLLGRYTYDDLSGIPDQWQLFAGHVGDVRGRIGGETYGVMLPIDGATRGFDYLTGVEVSGAGDLPAGFSHTRIPAARYAVFEHRGHVAGIRGTWDAAWSRWLPESGYSPVADPVLFEQYETDFDPATGRGVVGLWIPVQAP